MSNTFNVIQYILDEVFIRFIDYLSYSKVANRNLESDFKNLKYATGQTINYRLEERFLGGEGASATDEDVVQVVRPLTINKQFHSMVSFNGMELTFDRARDQPYLDMMLKPRAKTLANKVEKFICTDNLQPAIYQTVGTPGVPVDFQTVLNTVCNFASEKSQNLSAERYSCDVLPLLLRMPSPPIALEGECSLWSTRLLISDTFL